MTGDLLVQARPLTAGLVPRAGCTYRANYSPAAAIHGIVGVSCQGRGVAIVRYRFRAYPTGGQVQALARTFGCARVVYNDCVRLRRDAHARSERLSDTEVQRRVITLTKRTPEREWLGEVASVALVQACQDARRAHRNWLDSLTGRRKGRRIGHPRFRSRKDGRQSVQAGPPWCGSSSRKPSATAGPW